MYKQCRTEASARRQQQIIDRFFALLQTRDFNQITVADLCRQAGIPRKAFYRYFDNMGDVLEAAIDFFLLRFGGTLLPWPDCSRAQMQQALEHIFDGARQNREILLTMERSGLTGRIMQQITRKSLAYSACHNAPFLAGSPDTYRMVHNFLTCSLLILLMEWLQRGCPESPAEIAQKAIHLFSKPLMPMIESEN